MRRNLYITGFSGTGKTTVGREAARLLGFRFVDLDDEIVRAAGRSIEEIFSGEGEARFRQLERDTLERVSRDKRQVVSTGGGIAVDERNRRVMEESGVIVCLEARPEAIYERLTQQDEIPGRVVRPMLEAPDPMARIRSLKAERQSSYALAHWTVHTDNLTPVQGAEEVVRAWKLLSDSEYAGDPDLAAIVRTSSGDYPVWVGWGVMAELGQRVKRVLSPQVAYVISDEGVYRHARRAQMSLEAAGIASHLFQMPRGERHKTLETAMHLYRWLAELRAERGHLVVAVGGGVVGDLAGFVAATYVRGMPLVQVPTSLLAMMDSSIGGKVAVDLPQGKNLVGAFYQPWFVLADVEVLQTLPRRELVSGWAEAIKHGLIMDEALLRTFEEHRAPVQALEPDIATEVIRRSVAIKARVVSQDERETLGIRVLLNYGHTIGHALEAATGYGSLLHGEAVSIGMMGEAYISEAMGMLRPDEVERQRAVLEAYGLPLSCGEVDIEVVSLAMRSDKKTSSGAIRWVLLDRIGHAVTRNDVPEALVQETLRRLAQ